MSAPNALTAIKGGINRARIKGGARQDTLYNLLNGYVTVGNTIKVRPGTFRSTDLSTTTFGSTKGLISYAGSRHIFSAQSGSVPGGYTLHVLNHPAVNQQRLVTANTTISVLGQGAVSTGILGATVSNSYQAGIGGSGDHGQGTGSITAGATSIGSFPIMGIGYTFGANGMFPINNHVNGFVLGVTGTCAKSLLNTISWTDANGLHTLNGADATFDTTSFPGFSYWTWPLPVPNFTGSIVVTISSYSSPTFTDPIPIKEIHAVFPFMGFLYVVAEFTGDGGSGLGTIFHYWIQTSGKWAAATIYQVGQVITPNTPNGYTYRAQRISQPNPGWAANTLEAVSNKVEPTTPNGYLFTATAIVGTNPLTGPTEPVWPTTEGATVFEETEKTNTGVVSAAAPQPSTTTPSPGTGTKYTNPYAGK